MRQALRDNKVSFVKLLLNNGVVMKNMINPKVLRELYNAVSCFARPSLGTELSSHRVYDQKSRKLSLSQAYKYSVATPYFLKILYFFFWTFLKMYFYWTKYA